MRREQSNQIRFVLEELLPPILRDTALFRFAASLAWGKHIATLAEFRKSAPFLNAEQYSDLYRTHPRVHEDTDNSHACLERIAADVLGPTVCDIGCGTGALLRYVREHSGKSLVWTAPSWQELSSRFTALVGAAMCSAFRCGSHDRWP